MDGYELSTAIKSANPKLPIILLTAKLSISSKKDFDQVLRKPITMRDLSSVLSKFLKYKYNYKASTCSTIKNIKISELLSTANYDYEEINNKFGDLIKEINEKLVINDFQEFVVVMGKYIKLKGYSDLEPWHEMLKVKCSNFEIPSLLSDINDLAKEIRNYIMLNNKARW